jgi:hypothetical protein
LAGKIDQIYNEHERQVQAQIRLMNPLLAREKELKDSIQKVRTKREPRIAELEQSIAEQQTILQELQEQFEHNEEKGKQESRPDWESLFKRKLAKILINKLTNDQLRLTNLERERDQIKRTLDNQTFTFRQNCVPPKTALRLINRELTMLFKVEASYAGNLPPLDQVRSLFNHQIRQDAPQWHPNRNGHLTLTPEWQLVFLANGEQTKPPFFLSRSMLLRVSIILQKAIRDVFLPDNPLYLIDEVFNDLDASSQESLLDDLRILALESQSFILVSQLDHNNPCLRLEKY